MLYYFYSHKCTIIICVQNTFMHISFMMNPDQKGMPYMLHEFSHSQQLQIDVYEQRYHRVCIMIYTSLNSQSHKQPLRQTISDATYKFIQVQITITISSTRQIRLREDTEDNQHGSHTRVNCKTQQDRELGNYTYY